MTSFSNGNHRVALRRKGIDQSRHRADYNPHEPIRNQHGKFIKALDLEFFPGFHGKSPLRTILARLTPKRTRIKDCNKSKRNKLKGKYVLVSCHSVSIFRCRVIKKKYTYACVYINRLVISKHRILSQRQLPGSSSDASSFCCCSLWYEQKMTLLNTRSPTVILRMGSHRPKQRCFCV